jgi:membrane-associated progesterone receptor component
MSGTEQPKKERFAPKEPVTLNPPKEDSISREHLAKCDGELTPLTAVAATTLSTI